MFQLSTLSGSTASANENLHSHFDTLFSGGCPWALGSDAAGWVAFRNCKCSAGDPLVVWKTEIWMKRLNYFTKTHRLNHHNLNDYFKLEIHLRPPLGSYRGRLRKQMLATLGSSISGFSGFSRMVIVLFHLNRKVTSSCLHQVMAHTALPIQTSALTALRLPLRGNLCPGEA